MPPKRRATKPTTAATDDQDGNLLSRLVAVACFHEDEALQKREEFMAIVRNAGGDINFIHGSFVYFTFIVPAGQNNPLLVHVDNDTWMQERVLNETVSEVKDEPLAAQPEKKGAEQEGAKQKDAGQKGAEGGAEDAEGGAEDVEGGAEDA